MPGIATSELGTVGDAGSPVSFNPAYHKWGWAIQALAIGPGKTQPRIAAVYETPVPGIAAPPLSIRGDCMHISITRMGCLGTQALPGASLMQNNLAKATFLTLQ
jgi:hypothetical protein